MYDILKNHIEKIISLTDSEFEFVVSFPEKMTVRE